MKDTLLEKILSLLDLESKRQYDILDLGCGSGDLLARVSGNVAPGSSLIGIDAMKQHIDQAKKSYPHMDFRQEKSIDSFPFPDAAFDIVVSVDTLECIPDKTALVEEVARVLRPTGSILFAHWDWDTQAYNSEHKEVIRKFVAEFSDWQQGWMDASDGQMGKRLWGLFEGSGLFRGFMESFTLLETQYEKGQYGFDRLQDLAGLVKPGKIGETEYEMICDEMTTLAKNKRYFYSVNSYIYVGGKA
ncbi:MAG TPA: methyltransferase domain-containing protein [Candidatus Hydrogenedentes bacterium]|nr:methyltransferase domain-containing protein [Candidatus Hydrogenedentota bacterium]